MKHNQDLFSGLSAKIDLDVVSDQDYLHEFKSGYDGFLYTRDYFRDTFGREINDETETVVRQNRLNLNRSWDNYTFSADLLVER